MTPADPHRTALTVLAVCFALNFTARGLAESFVVFVLPLADSFSWDRAAVVSIQSVAMLATGFSAPFAGRLFDRFGPRIVYALGLALFGAGMSLAPFAQTLWHFQICLGLAVGLGAACLGNAPNSALLSRWFKARLALAMSTLWSAAGIGVLTLVPLAQIMVGQGGWRSAYSIFGAAAFLAVIPALLLPWKTYAAGIAEPVRDSEAAAPDAAGWTLRRAVRQPAFWGLFAVFLFTSAGMYAVVVQVIAYLVDVGFSPLQAATAWGFSGLLLPVGMIGFGWLDGRIGRRPTIVLSYAMSLSGVALLWLLSRHQSMWLLAGFILLFGGTAGSRGPLISTIAMRLFQGRNMGAIFGSISIGAGLGAAFGSWFGGVLHDWSGDYDPVLGWAFSCLLCGQLPFWVVPALRR